MSAARYTLAVDRYRKKEGEDTADFIHCVTFTKGAEFAQKYLKKGMKITIRGSIQTGSYTNRDGMKVSTTEVVVSEHAFCESRQASVASYNNNQAGYQNQGQSYQSQSYQNPLPNNQGNNYGRNYAAAGSSQTAVKTAVPSPNTSAVPNSPQTSYQAPSTPVPAYGQDSYRAPASSAPTYEQTSYQAPAPTPPAYNGAAGAGYSIPNSGYHIPNGNNNSKPGYTKDNSYEEGFMNIPDGIDEELPFN